MSETVKLQRASDNAARALAKLEEFLAEPVARERDIAGIIQAFEFTFEAFWKLLQKVAEAQGLAAPSPKKAVAAGYRVGICAAEDVWLDMLEDRNLTSHTYNQAVANRIYDNIRLRYAPELRASLQRAAKEIADL